MIIIHMDLHSAVTRKISKLATVKIVNDGTGTIKRGNYNYTVIGKKGRVLKEGRVEKWPRLSKTPAALLQRVLNTAYPKGV